MSVEAVLFDIDGTLVDSNYLHVEAWSHALDDAGYEVDHWRVHRAIGMDSEKLLDAVAGEHVGERIDRAKRLNSTYYSALAPRLRVFGGARELIRALADRGLTVVLATSAPDAELAILRDLLDVEDSIAVVTSAGDVDNAKPAPDIVRVALERSGSDAASAIMVGDTGWDVEAAASAGVRTIGVESGGWSRLDLAAAGAIAVYEDVAALLAALEESPLV